MISTKLQFPSIREASPNKANCLSSIDITYIVDNKILSSKNLLGKTKVKEDFKVFRSTHVHDEMKNKTQTHDDEVNLKKVRKHNMKAKAMMLHFE